MWYYTIYLPSFVRHQSSQWFGVKSAVEKSQAAVHTVCRELQSLLSNVILQTTQEQKTNNNIGKCVSITLQVFLDDQWQETLNIPEKKKELLTHPTYPPRDPKTPEIRRIFLRYSFADRSTFHFEAI